MQILIALAFATAICAVIEFVVPSQIALFYSMLGGTMRRESRKAIDTPAKKRMSGLRFIILLLPAIALTYFTVLSEVWAVVALMVFILGYSSYISFNEIRAIRKNHLAVERSRTPVVR